MNREQFTREYIDHAENPFSNVDHDILRAETLALHYETLRQRADRAERGLDPAFANDLRFAASVAEALKAEGKMTLVVGGYARDEAIARETGNPQTSKDLDMEVYGIGFYDLAVYLEQFGPVDLVGASFGVAKLRNRATGHLFDFSIPRADSKVDKGHTGFQVTGDPGMSVRDAAKRRDLTINALALDPLTGEMIDDFGGLHDIKDRILRATDFELFGDDPLRALRVMQFAGRFNFKVDPETAKVCHGFKLKELPRERIGEEWIKLMTKSERPSAGIAVARELGILQQLHPEMAILETIEQEPEWHPEGNVLTHSMLSADAAAHVVREEGLTGSDALVVLFGALVHDFGKATTTEVRIKNGQPRITAHGHEAAGVEPATRFLCGLKLSSDVIEKILPIVREHLYHMHNPHPTDKQLQKFAERLQPANIRLWDLVSRCDSNGRQGEFTIHTPSYEIYQRSLDLKVSEAPVPHMVNGGHVIHALGVEKGPKVSAVVEWLYDAQLEGKFEDVAHGLAYASDHTQERETAVAEILERKQQAREKAAAERRAKTDALRALPRAERQRIAKEAHERAMAERARRDVARAERDHLKAAKAARGREPQN